MRQLTLPQLYAYAARYAMFADGKADEIEIKIGFAALVHFLNNRGSGIPPEEVGKTFLLIEDYINEDFNLGILPKAVLISNLNNSPKEVKIDAIRIMLYVVEADKIIDEREKAIVVDIMKHVNVSFDDLKVPGSENTQKESKKNEVSSEEVLTLQFTPLWIFEAVSGADGKVENRELDVLLKEATAANSYKNQLVREILSTLNSEFNTIVEMYKRDTRGAKKGLEAANTILDNRLPIEDAQSFKRVMLGIGIEIARGLGPIGFGDKMGNEEKNALNHIASIFQISSLN